MSLTDIESKVTELSILRILGMDKNNVIFILLFKGIYYSFPAFIIGLFLNYIFRLAISYKTDQMFKLSLSPQISNEILYYSILQGVIMPIISSILPARRAIKKSLSESINTIKRFSIEIQVLVTKLQKYGISPYTLCSSVLMICMGYLCYYHIPRTFLKKDVDSFFQILNLMLLIFIFGLVILLQLTQKPFQKLTAKLLCKLFAKNKSMLNLVLNNFEVHSRKINKIFFVYSLSFSFFIFITLGLNL